MVRVTVDSNAAEVKRASGPMTRGWTRAVLPRRLAAQPEGTARARPPVTRTDRRHVADSKCRPAVTADGVVRPAGAKSRAFSSLAWPLHAARRKKQRQCAPSLSYW